MPYKITRIHEICCGHRVYGHEGKCKYPHGHNYKFELTVASDGGLDELGRIIDFSHIKTALCMWLEKEWDHKMLLWNKDPLGNLLIRAEGIGKGIVLLSCNPTAENLAEYFCENIAPGLLIATGVRLVKVVLWETSKCSAEYTVKDYNESTQHAERRTVSSFEESV